MVTRLALSCYHRLPAIARQWGASAYGLYLRGQRYGKATEKLIEQAGEREHWSSSQWKFWQQERLSRILHIAATRVPYYREQWQERRRKGDRTSWECLENWPILEKASVQANPHAFISDDSNRRSLVAESTSGTSGSPLKTFRSMKTIQAWHALMEARTLRWCQLSRADRYAMIGGQPIVRYEQKKPPLWVWNGPMRQMYLSAYHLSPALIPYYLDAMKEHRIEYLSGYPSAIEALARGIPAGSPIPFRLKSVHTHSETLFPQQRELIERTFGCPVYESYGLTELVAAASECPARSLHIWPDVAFNETVEDSVSSAGELIGTGLLNMDAPLIRYRTGDSLSFAADQTCSCGRTLPVILALHGRIEDWLVAHDGTRVPFVLPADLPVRETQIIQESKNFVRVLYVPQKEPVDHAMDPLALYLRELLGLVAVEVTAVPAIPHGLNGKFRPIICRI